MIYHIVSIKFPTASYTVPGGWNKSTPINWTTGQTFEITDSYSPTCGYGDLDLRIQPIKEGFEGNPIATGIAPSAELEFSLSNITNFLADLDGRNRPMCLIGAKVFVKRVNSPSGTQPYNPTTDTATNIYFGVIAQITVDSERATIIARQDDLSDVDLTKNTRASGSIKTPIVFGDMSGDDAWVKVPAMDGPSCTNLDLGLAQSGSDYALHSAWMADKGTAEATWGSTSASTITKAGSNLLLSWKAAAGTTDTALSATGYPDSASARTLFDKAPADPVRVLIEDEGIDLCTNIPTADHTGAGLTARLFAQRGAGSTTPAGHANGLAVYQTDAQTEKLLTANLRIESVIAVKGGTSNASQVRLHGDPADFKKGGKITTWGPTGYDGWVTLKIKTNAIPALGTLKSLQFTVKVTGSVDYLSTTSAPGWKQDASLTIHGKDQGIFFTKNDFGTAKTANKTFSDVTILGFAGDPSKDPISIKLSAQNTSWVSLQILSIKAVYTTKEAPAWAWIKCAATTNLHRNLLTSILPKFDSRSITLNDFATGTWPNRATPLSGASTAANLRDLLRDISTTTATVVWPKSQLIFQFDDPYQPRTTRTGPTTSQQIGLGNSPRADLRMSTPDFKSLYTAVAVNWLWSELEGRYMRQLLLSWDSTKDKWDIQTPPTTASRTLLSAAKDAMGSERTLEFEAPFVRQPEGALDLVDTLVRTYARLHRTATLTTTMEYAMGLSIMDKIDFSSSGLTDLTTSEWILCGRTYDPQNHTATLTLWEI